MTKQEDEKKRDSVLKRMMTMSPESNKDMAERRNKERKQKARDSLKDE